MFGHACRWPWPLFQLMHGSLTQPSDIKKTVANQLLSHSDELLEITTLRIKRLCLSDLQHVAKTGMLEPGSRLHGILLTVATHLKLDAGELESLNSMIKSALFEVTIGIWFRTSHIKTIYIERSLHCRSTA